MDYNFDFRIYYLFLTLHIYRDIIILIDIFIENT